jgi:hypothetical protein
MKRTNETDLSNDELILFDVLFNYNVPINALKNGVEFSLNFNCQSHNLDVNELRDTIERFVSKGQMKFKLCVMPKDKQIVTFVCLTENGGNIWEKEHLPIWESYVRDSSSHCNGFWELSIFSPTMETAMGFLEIAQECNLYELMDNNDIIINEIRGKDTDLLIPWKYFDRLYELKSRLAEKKKLGNSKETDWDHYNSNIMWWRDVDELQLLKDKTSI